MYLPVHLIRDARELLENKLKKPISFHKICSESDSGLYTAKASNGPDSSTCSAQLIVRESEYHIGKSVSIKYVFFFDQKKKLCILTESDEEKKSLVDQNTPFFAIRLTDIEVMENTFLRFMVKVLGEPQPKIQL